MIYIINNGRGKYVRTYIRIEGSTYSVVVHVRIRIIYDSVIQSM